MTSVVRVEVNVTAEHIRKGRQRECAECPVALALAEVVPGATDIRITPSSAYWAVNGRHTRSSLPVEVTRWIDRFDERGGKRRARPMTFPLDIPVPDPTEAA